MWSDRITEHAYKRIKERIGIKNIAAMDRMAELALSRGYRAYEIKDRFSRLLEALIRSDTGVYPVIYNGFYFFFNEEDRLVTVYRAERKDMHSFNAFRSKARSV